MAAGSTEDPYILRVKGVSYRFSKDKQLTFPDMECSRGGHLLIKGASGSGKTTLLHLIAGLRSLQQGRIEVDGHVLGAGGEEATLQIRRKSLAIVFQQDFFIASLSALDNVRIAAALAGLATATERSMELLHAVGLHQVAAKLPQHLSGGEKQRLAIARALCTSPALVLADEPTSHLDAANAHQVLDLMLSQCEREGSTLVAVSHDDRITSRFSHCIAL